MDARDVSTVVGATVIACLSVLAVLLSFSLSLRAISGFLLGWVAEFKLLLLACGQGPVHPTSLPLAAFFAVATSPVVTALQHHPNSSTTIRPTTAATSLGFVEHAVMAVLLAAVTSLYRYEEQMNDYVLLTLYTVHVYLALELVLSAAAATAHALMALEPQFDLSASLRDLPALRQGVFRPVRASPAGVLAAFAVSGLMHEAMFSYIIVLHGAFAVAERCRTGHEGWPRALTSLVTLAFVGVTGFWLFFPANTRTGASSR